MQKDFSTVIQEHFERYPLMQPQDFAKLLYQSEFGPRHMLQNPAQAAAWLQKEWQELPENLASPAKPEQIGGGLSRFHLSRSQARQPELYLTLLNRLFQQTAQQKQGSQAELQERIAQLLALPLAARLPDLPQWLARWAAEGFPPVHHSQAFNAAYQPHYRLLRADYALFFPALLAAAELLAANRPAIIALDGRCGSGKTTLSCLLAELFPCRIVHMDDFYLPHNERPDDWRQRPAGHMNLPRLQAEVLAAAQKYENISYRPYSCQQARLLPARQLPPAPLTVIEGSYSLHPQLAACYDLKIFLRLDSQEQKARLQIREGQYYPEFEDKWIPQEENYLQKCAVAATADLQIDTTELPE